MHDNIVVGVLNYFHLSCLSISSCDTTKYITNRITPIIGKILKATNFNIVKMPITPITTVTNTAASLKSIDRPIMQMAHLRKKPQPQSLFRQ